MGTAPYEPWTVQNCMEAARLALAEEIARAAIARAKAPTAPLSGHSRAAMWGWLHYEQWQIAVEFAAVHLAARQDRA